MRKNIVTADERAIRTKLWNWMLNGRKLKRATSRALRRKARIMLRMAEYA